MFRPGPSKPVGLFLGLLLAALATSCRVRPPTEFPEFVPGVAYTNSRTARVPWSVHIVRVDRANRDWEFRTTRTPGTTLGLSTLTDQIKSLNPELGTPLAAVNGDYYQMAGTTYAGDPRGLQLVDGELISTPIGGVSFWMDAAGQPHATNVVSQCTVTWPDGRTTIFGLDEGRKTNSAILYTSTVGKSTRTINGLELVLEPIDDTPWRPFHLGQTLTARVRDVRAAGNTSVEPGTMVLSLDRKLAVTLLPVFTGIVLKLSFESQPDLRGVRTAISGGPMLVRQGQRQKWQKDGADGPLPYEFSSMSERHPRTALGWNDRYFFLVGVDGRQTNLSLGMTLSELADYMIGLGCTEVMNLDGGGSATLWCNGQVRSKPSDKRSVALSKGDFTDLPALAARLEQQPDTVSQYLAEQFSYATRELLWVGSGCESNSPALEDALVEEMNKIIRGPSIYEAQRFLGVPLSEEIRKLLAQPPKKGEGFLRLNRLLLEAVYPTEIAKSLEPREREIANGLVVMRQTIARGKPEEGLAPSAN